MILYDPCNMSRNQHVRQMIPTRARNAHTHYDYLLLLYDIINTYAYLFRQP